MSPIERSHDADRPGHWLLRDGEPVAVLVWTHDFGERARTGWFLVPLDDDGEPDDTQRLRLEVSDDVALLRADTASSRADWLARAETVELVTAGAALAAAELVLERHDS